MLPKLRLLGAFDPLFPRGTQETISSLAIAIQLSGSHGMHDWHHGTVVAWNQSWAVYNLQILQYSAYLANVVTCGATVHLTGYTARVFSFNALVKCSETLFSLRFQSSSDSSNEDFFRSSLITFPDTCFFCKP